MAWILPVVVCAAVASVAAWGGYLWGRDSCMHDAEDATNDTTWRLKQLHAKDLVVLRKAHLKDLHELFDAVEAAFEAKMPERFEPLTGTCGEPKE